MKVKTSTVTTSPSIKAAELTGNSLIVIICSGFLKTTLSIREVKLGDGVTSRCVPPSSDISHLRAGNSKQRNSARTTLGYAYSQYYLMLCVSNVLILH